MSWSVNVSPRDKRRAERVKLRQDGYRDGYALQPPKMLDAEYQRSWRRGKEARERDD